MTKIQIIDLNSKSKWDEIVKDADEIYDKWQYVSAFYKNADGVPYMAYLEGKEGYIYNVFMKRNINNDEKFKGMDLKEQLYDIITTYGYGGVKINGNITKEEKDNFFTQFKDYCVSNNIISEFIRLDPIENNYKLYDGYDYVIEKRSNTIYIELENKEKIWDNLKGSCRNKIRKAINNNLYVKSGFNDEMFNEFEKIYNETMKRDNADNYYYFKKEFFNDIKENLKDNAIIYTVYKEELPISSTIILYKKNNVHYHLSGTLSDYMKLGANNLLLYEVAKDFSKRGYKKFHLGGGYGGNDSPLFELKKSFNKNGLLDFYIGKKIYNKEKYNELCNIRNIKEILSDFFPLYRS